MRDFRRAQRRNRLVAERDTLADTAGSIAHRAIVDGAADGATSASRPLRTSACGVAAVGEEALPGNPPTVSDEETDDRRDVDDVRKTGFREGAQRRGR